MALGPNTPATRPHRRLPETKPFYLTSEFGIAVITSLAILIASALVDTNADDPDGGFGARGAWLMITIIITGYILSRGIAKAGSREHFNDQP
jgi:hypothetical protein